MQSDHDYPSDEEIVYGDGAPLYAQLTRVEKRVDVGWKSNFDSLKGIKSLKEKYASSRQSTDGERLHELAAQSETLLSLFASSEASQTRPVPDNPRPNQSEKSIKGLKSKMEVPISQHPPPFQATLQSLSNSDKSKPKVEKAVFVDDKPSHWKQNSKHMQLLGQKRVIGKQNKKQKTADVPFANPINLTSLPQPQGGVLSFAPSWLPSALPSRPVRTANVHETVEDVSPTTPHYPPGQAPHSAYAVTPSYPAYPAFPSPYEYDHADMLVTASPAAYAATSTTPLRPPSSSHSRAATSRSASSSRTPKVGSLRWRLQKISREREAGENALYTMLHEAVGGVGGMGGGIADPRTRTHRCLVGEVVERLEGCSKAFSGVLVHVHEVHEDAEEHPAAPAGDGMEAWRDKNTEMAAEDHHQNAAEAPLLEDASSSKLPSPSRIRAGDVAVLLLKATSSTLTHMHAGQRVKVYDYVRVAINPAILSVLNLSCKQDIDLACPMPTHTLLSTYLHEVL
eukprot:gene34092-41265_t